MNFYKLLLERSDDTHKAQSEVITVEHNIYPFQHHSQDYYY